MHWSPSTAMAAALVAACVLSPPVHAKNEVAPNLSTPGALLWEDRIDSGGLDYAGTVALGQQNVVVAGLSETAPGSGDFNVAVRAYDSATGKLTWQDVFHSGSYVDGTPVVTVGKDVAVVGVAPGILRAYDIVRGTLLWEDAYAPTSVGSVQAVTMRGNHVVATGYGGQGCADADDFIGCDMTTRAYEVRTGRLLWQDTFDGSGGYDQGTFVAATENIFVVTGYTMPDAFDLSDGSAYVVRAYDAGSGALLWKDVGPILPTFPFATQVAAGAGRIFVVGNDNDGDWLVRAYHPRTGAVLWNQTYHLGDAGLAGAPDIAFQIATDGARVVVAGYGSHPRIPPRISGARDRDAVVNTYDANTGDLLWSDVLDVAGGLDEAVGGVAISGRQAFVLSVATRAPVSALASQDILVRAYDITTGRLLWQDEVDKGGSEFPWGTWFKGIAAGYGRVTIVGSSVFRLPDRSLSADWIVRTYDASASGGDDEP